MIPEWDGEDGEVLDFDASLANIDDLHWSYRVFALNFLWQTYFDWWVSRRYVMPRDVRRR